MQFEVNAISSCEKLNGNGKRLSPCVNSFRFMILKNYMQCTLTKN